MEDFKALLKDEFAPFGSLSDHQAGLLQRHYELLLQWNQRINLTRITSLLDAVRYHYCESLYLAKYLPMEPLKIVDIGSGAGFPGIPVAVLRADCTLDLVESHQRKSVFLSEVVRQLALPNVRVIAKRAEHIDAVYDWTISRAVKSEDVLAYNLSLNTAILGTVGERLPWGQARALFHVERPNLAD